MTATAIIDLDVPVPIISRQAYGHVAAHLGRCAYGGFWVGEDPKVPNVRGLRAACSSSCRRTQLSSSSPDPP